MSRRPRLATHTPARRPAWSEAAFQDDVVEWKVGDTAAAITAEAKRRGKWVHMGRVNSDQRIRRAVEMGVDSADGTYLAHGPDINLIRLLGWLQPDDWRWMRADQQRRAVAPTQDALFAVDLAA